MDKEEYLGVYCIKEEEWEPGLYSVLVLPDKQENYAVSSSYCRLQYWDCENGAKTTFTKYVRASYQLFIKECERRQKKIDEVRNGFTWVNRV